MYIENNQQHHHHLQRHHQPRHIVDHERDTAADESASTSNNTDTADRSRRSVRQFKRRITIVPVDHHTLHKRHTTDTAAAFNLTACCVRRHCTCDTMCAHRCAANELPVVVQHASQLPGDCCDRIRCEQPDEPAACYSTALHRRFEHAQRWDEGACTQCECVDGERTCQATMCRPLACQHKIVVAGECCPRCDESRSAFCAGEAGCAIACRWGYAEDDERSGCKLCKCMRSGGANRTTTTTTTTVEPPPIEVEVTASSTSVSPSSSSTVYSTEASTTAAPPATGADPTLLELSPPFVDHDHRPPVASPPLAGSDPTDPTVLSIRSYFEAHHLYIIVSATVFTTAMLFAGLVWTYCIFSNKNSYNIVPNA